jgi:pectate lyase
VVRASKREPACGGCGLAATVTVRSLLQSSFLIVICAARCHAQTPSFPGAEGGGAGARGGRGGAVIEVTNLNDAGEGSLRACVEAEVPRTCVFRVGGVIHVGVGIRAYHDHLTIAGQTAPGGGITLDGSHASQQAVLFLSASNVIVRYLTIRIGDGPSHSPGPSTGAVAFQVANNKCHDIIFDHVTASWWDNKGLLYSSNFVGPNREITAQWSMFYEPHADHPVGPSISSNPTKGQGFGNLETDLDYHHNLFANIGHRIPQLWNKSSRWVNNIVYNWDFYASDLLGQVNADFIANKYKAGPLNSEAQRREIEATPKGAFENPGAPTLYLLGNIGPNQPSPSGDQWLMAAQVSGENGKEIGAIPKAWRRDRPLPAERFPITPDAATQLDARILPTVGNSLRLDCLGNWVMKRDPVDRRIITEYRDGTIGDFYTMEDVDHEIPRIDPGSACQDTDHDGIPDAWEIAHGLDPRDSSDGKKLGADGYSNLERYLNGSSPADAGLAGLITEGEHTGIGSVQAQPKGPLSQRVRGRLLRLGYHIKARARRARSDAYWLLLLPALAVLFFLAARLFGQRHKVRTRTLSHKRVFANIRKG